MKYAAVFKEVNSKYSENFGPNCMQKGKDLADFGLLCILIMNCCINCDRLGSLDFGLYLLLTLSEDVYCFSKLTEHFG